MQTRVKEQRKKPFDEAQRAAVADTASALAAAGKAAPASAPSTADLEKQGDKGTEQTASGTGAGAADAAVTAAAGPGKPELEARLKYLQEAYKKLDDPGEQLIKNRTLCTNGASFSCCWGAAVQPAL